MTPEPIRPIITLPVIITLIITLTITGGIIIGDGHGGIHRGGGLPLLSSSMPIFIIISMMAMTTAMGITTTIIGPDITLLQATTRLGQRRLMRWLAQELGLLRHGPLRVPAPLPGLLLWQAERLSAEDFMVRLWGVASTARSEAVFMVEAAAGSMVVVEAEGARSLARSFSLCCRVFATEYPG